jgi:acetyl esterase/lipase
LYEEWFADWAIKYCLQHSAVIVAADHRLMPESTGSDILEDVSDFYNWVRDGLRGHLSKAAPGIEADLDKVISYGESAGGYLAIQSGFSQPPGFIKAAIATYPLIDLTPKRTAPIFGAPTIPSSVLEGVLKGLEPGKITSSAEPPARLPIAISMAQQNRLSEFFGVDDKLSLASSLQTLDDVPFIFIAHGKDDSAVPAEGSINFVKVVEQKFGSGKTCLRIEPGEHGFDGTATLDTPWLKEGLSRVTELWLN